MTRARTILSLLLLPLLISHASAQLGEDIWLTSDWARPVNLPADIQIQSAARIGTTTLAAWGTTVRGTDDSIIPAIVAQRIEGTTPVDGPVFVHGSSARPSGVVSVVNLDTAFVVLWNDRRSGAPGVYARSIGRSGGLIGSEEFFVSTQLLVTDTLVWLHRDGGVTTIVWQATQGEEVYYHSLAIGEDGSTNGSPTTLETINFDDTVRVGTLPGCTIVGTASGHPHLWYPDGKVDDREIPITHVRNPHLILEDTSAYVMIWKKPNVLDLEYYSSLYDTTPSRLIRVDSSGAILEIAGMVTRDSQGVISVSYGRRSYDGWSFYFAHLVSRKLLDTGRFDTVTVGTEIGSYLDKSSASYYATGSITGVSYSPGDSEAGRIRFEVFTSSYSKGSEEYRSTRRTVTFDLDASGVRYLEQFDLAAMRTDDIRLRYPVRRSIADRLSVVEITVNGETVSLTAPTSWLNLFTDKRRPVLIDREGHLLLVTDERVDSVVYKLREWLPDHGDSTLLIGTLRLPMSYYRSFGNKTEWLKVFSSCEPLNNAAVIVCASESGARYSSGSGGNLVPYSFVPTTNGFEQSVHPSTINGTSGLLLGSYDPNLQESIAYAGVNPGGLSKPLNWIIGLNHYGDTTWSFAIPGRAISGVIGVAPVAHGNVLVINHDSIYSASFGRVVPLSALPTKSTATEFERYYRFFGSLFVRVYPDSTPDAAGYLHDSIVNIQLFDTSGILKTTTALTIPRGYYRPTVVEFGATGPIGLLWGSDSGLHMTVVDRALKTLVADTIISASRYPARHGTGVARGDTLYVIWEDARMGMTDLFANRWVLPASLRSTQPNPHDTGATNPPTPPGLATAITLAIPVPNPAFGESVTVELVSLKSTSVIVEIVDNLGRTVERWAKQTIPIGSTQLTIRTDALHPGAYLVVVTNSDGEMSQTRLAVAR